MCTPSKSAKRLLALRFGSVFTEEGVMDLSSVSVAGSSKPWVAESGGWKVVPYSWSEAADSCKGSS